MTSPDVLFVVLDSARKDRVSTYGHGRRTTPALTDLAEDATRFENAYTPAPWTLPSHCSMFTGQFPSEHGVTNGYMDRSVRLPSRITTLAERLSAAGYATGGFSNNPWVGGLSGLDRGFDEFVEWDLKLGQRADRRYDARERALSRAHRLVGYANKQPIVLLKRRFFTETLVGRATRWIRRTERPTFTFLNLMEAHGPYYPPSGAFDDLGLDEPGPLEPRVLNVKLAAYLAGRAELRPDTRERLLEYYDASLRYQDGVLRTLLNALRDAGSYDDTLVIVCADHGKTLGEFDRSGAPPHYLREVNTNVPLVVKRPGQTAGRRVTAPFELTGLHRVVLDGGSTPVAENDDEDADGDADPEAALIEDFLPHTGEEGHDPTRWRAVTDGTRTYLRAETGATYRLAGHGTDETVVPREGATADAGADPLRAALDRRVRELDTADATDEGDAADVGRGTRSQLRDLGYLG